MIKWCLLYSISFSLWIMGGAGLVRAEDVSGNDNDMAAKSLQVDQTIYFSEFAAPADLRLHESVVSGLIKGKRPRLADDFLLRLRRTKHGEGTVFVWDRALESTNVAGAHLNQYIIFVLPTTLIEGEHKVMFGKYSNNPLEIYAIYADTEISWLPLFSCIGVAVDGDVVLNKISAKEIEAKIDVSFDVVEAIEWKSSDFCDQKHIEADIVFSQKLLSESQ